MNKKLLGVTGLLTAGLVAGSAFMLSTTANAATDSSSTASSSTSAPSFSNQNAQDLFSATPVRSDEQAVSSSVSDKLTAAAQAQLADATVIRIETDGDGHAYEVHLKQADGSVVTLYFDESYNYVSQEAGFGPAPAGAPDGSQPPADAPAPSAQG